MDPDIAKADDRDVKEQMKVIQTSISFFKKLAGV